MIGILMLAVAMTQVQEPSQTQITAQSDTASAVKVISLDDALKIALSENTSVKIADMEITRSGYAKKGTYASLYPRIDLSGSYQRTIKKQVMYMDFEMPAGMGGGAMADGLEVGRWNTWSAGVSASMPLVNAQLWRSIKISAQDVELSVEKARSSRIETVTQVKNAYYTVLLAKESFKVYRSVYENALQNCQQIQRKYNAQKASELELTRAKATLANAIPNVYDAESSVTIALWHLKAVMGISLDENIDTEGELADYAASMFADITNLSEAGLEGSSTMRQLSIQAEELANMVKMHKEAYIPTLSLAFSYSLNAMTNDFKFSQYKWSPYSFVGLSLSIPVFSGFQRLNQVRQTKTQAAELNLQRTETERQLRINIRQFLNVMETQMKSYSAAEDALATAEKAFNIAQKSYDVGRSTLTDLNDAQLAYTQASLNLNQTIFAFLSAKASLEGVLGFDAKSEK